MSITKLKSKGLNKALTFSLPQRMVNAIEQCLEEDEAYAADELVVLAEEILNQIAARGIADYLSSSKQKEVYNDFLIQLFTSSGHDYNAGPLYRWAANMLNDNDEFKNQPFYRFFYTNGALNVDVNGLSELRNKVVHGFFILPPEVNIEEADKMGHLLIQLAETDFFNFDTDFHFFNNRSFTGKWHITSSTDWDFFNRNSLFDKLAQRIIEESNDSFWENQILSSSKIDAIPALDAVLHPYLKEKRRSMAIWIHPNNKIGLSIFNNIAKQVSHIENTILVALSLHEIGISFTSEFLLNRLNRVLQQHGCSASSKKKLPLQIANMRSQWKGKIVVLVNDLHIALFNNQHTSSLANYFNEQDIHFIAIAHHFDYLARNFSHQFQLQSTPAIPDKNQRKIALHNYLRFKGPYADKEEDQLDYIQLCNSLDSICAKLETGQKIIARRFADMYGYDIEIVYECFALLQPWVKHESLEFEQDTIDELYGFPTTITETTSIYLSLGKRDVKLEYKHKVISL